MAEKINNQSNEYIDKTSEYCTYFKARLEEYASSNNDEEVKKLVPIETLISAGAHIPLPLRLKNNKMSKYIVYNKTKKFDAINLLHTILSMQDACDFIKELATERENKIILVSTNKNKIISDTIKDVAIKSNIMYVNKRWLGGILTNFKTLSKTLKKLDQLKQKTTSEDFKDYSKKERNSIMKKIERMESFIGGISGMRGMPRLLIVCDLMKEKNAINEANKMNIPIIALANTDANPSLVHNGVIIPINSRSTRAVYLAINILCDAIAEVTGKPTTIIGKTNNEIVLPNDLAKKDVEVNVVVHRKTASKNKEQTTS